jgi:uncharacterized protein YggE
MKRTLLLTVSILLLVILLAATGCDGVTSPPVRTSISNSSSGQNTGIWVSGTGEVSVTPDIAILQVGVQAKEETVLEAQEQASEAMEKVLRALTGSGVKDEDIQTQYFRIRQDTRWDSFNDEEEITGYEVTNTVTAKIRDIDNVGDIINAAVIAGGDLVRINDFSFTVEKPEAYYDEARELATADAKAKAEKLAKQTGVKLGDPTYISESGYTPSTYGGISYGLSASVVVPAPQVIIETPTSPGQVNVTLTVQIAYSIK